jgi:hypothetical protein
VFASEVVQVVSHVATPDLSTSEHQCWSICGAEKVIHKNLIRNMTQHGATWRNTARARANK